MAGRLRERVDLRGGGSGRGGGGMGGGGSSGKVNGSTRVGVEPVPMNRSRRLSTCLRTTLLGSKWT